MDALTEQISAILSDPQAMEKIKGLAASLGLEGSPETRQESPKPESPPQENRKTESGSPDLSGLLSGLSGLLGKSETPNSLASHSQEEGLNAASLLGLSGNSGNSSQADTGGLSGLLQALGSLGGTSSPGSSQGPSQNGAGSLLQGDLLPMLLKVAPLISSLQQETDGTRLLRALRPLLSPSRQKRLDEAIHMLQLMRILPFLKGNLFS